ncbi:MAG: hypothetical protein CME64_09675 [Halobacteriovoraceae bacterium]|nr:hypothetical protein [Halobacteriovoraceae bacterium]
MFFMTKHIVDAIVLNFRRCLPYMWESKGLSLPVSTILIFSEVVTIPTALMFDLMALSFQKKDLPVLKEDFVDMSLTPSFKKKV